MTQEAERILEEAKKLSPLDRAQLIENLHRSFDTSDDALITKAWATEAEDRLNAYKSGQLETIPAETIFDRLNK